MTNGILDAMKYYAGIDDSEIIAMVLTFISNMINESTEVMLFIFNAGFYEILIQLKDKVLSAVSLQQADFRNFRIHESDMQHRSNEE